MTMLTLSEVAARLGVSASTARRELARPGAPARYRVSTRCVRWEATEIDAWIASRAEEPKVTLADLPQSLRTANRRGPRRAV